MRVSLSGRCLRLRVSSLDHCLICAPRGAQWRHSPTSGTGFSADASISCSSHTAHSRSSAIRKPLPHAQLARAPRACADGKHGWRRKWRRKWRPLAQSRGPTRARRWKRAHAPFKSVRPVHRLHAELGTERETVAHLQAILERTAIDSSSQLLPYSDLVFAFATADVERAGKLRADALADALRAIGIARVPDAALASLRDAPGARGEREIDFASFARAASIAYVEHVRQLSAREEAIAAIRAAFDRRDPSRTGLVDAAECESMLRDAGLSAGAEAVRSALHAQRAGRDLDLFALVRLYDELVARGHAARSPAEMTADERARRAALRKAFNKYDSDRSGRCAHGFAARMLCLPSCAPRTQRTRRGCARGPRSAVAHAMKGVELCRAPLRPTCVALAICMCAHRSVCPHHAEKRAAPAPPLCDRA